MKSNEIVSLENVVFTFPKEKLSLKTMLSFSKETIHKKMLLDKVNLKILQGERLALMGRNGAGKTTLVSLLNKKITPCSGLIINRYNIRTIYGDFTSLWRATSLEDITLSYLRMLNQKLSNKMIYELCSDVISFCSLKGKEHLRFNHLSFGEQSKIIIAVYTATPCDFLIIDESFIGLDEGFLSLISKRIDMCLGEKGAFLLVSHNKDLIDKFCESGYYLDDKGALSRKIGKKELVDTYLKYCDQKSKQY